jgi:hypothetical protein
MCDYNQAAGLYETMAIESDDEEEDNNDVRPSAELLEHQTPIDFGRCS